MSDIEAIGPEFDIPDEIPAEQQEPIQEQEQVEQPQAEPEPQPEPLAEEPAKEPNHVPLVALLDEREKRQAAQRERDELKRQLEASQKPIPQQRIPDPYEDPNGYQQYVQGQIEERAFNVRAEMSGRFAEKEHGKETVEAAIRWAQDQAVKDPSLGQRVQASNDPVGFVVEQYKREQFWTKYGSDPAALEQARATHQTAAPQMAAPAASKPNAPPRSLAATPGAGGGHQSIPDGSVLDSVKFALD